MTQYFKKGLKIIACTLLAFFLSYNPLIDKLSPFGLSFVSALNPALYPFGFIGSVGGYLLSPAKEIVPLRYIASLLCFAVIRGALKDNKRASTPKFKALISGFVCLVTGLTIVISTRFTMGAVLLYIFESFLVCISTYFLSESFKVNYSGFNIHLLNAKESTALVVTGMLFVLSLSKLTFFYVTPILIVCAYYIMTICTLGEKYSGSFIGGILALILAFGTDNLYILAALLLGSILMTIFTKTGVIFATLAYVVGTVIAIPITDQISVNIVYSIHFLFGALLFILTPDFVAARIEGIFEKPVYTSSISRSTEKIIGQKLMGVGDKVLDISKLLDKIFSATESSYNLDLYKAQLMGIVSKQMENTSHIIQSLSESISDTTFFDIESQERVSRILSENDIYAKDVMCTVDSTSGLMYIEFECEKSATITSLLGLTKEIEEACEKSFELPITTESEEYQKVKFYERPSLKIDIGAHQITSKRSRRSGDTYTTFSTTSGKFFLILSDGMGSGSAAALGSALSIEVLTILIKEGVDFPCALEFANVAVMVNSPDECLATVDVICIDTYTGEADFYKAGAAATLVRHGHHIEKLDRIALPIGILKDTEFSHATAFLSPGDLILMSSDGIWVEDESEISNQLAYFRGEDMDELAKKISSAAAENADATDDITVIAAKVCRR